MRIVRARTRLALDAYAIEQDAVPEPGEGEVRIKMHACGVGYVDALIASGAYQVKPPLPHTPGLEVAGTVDAVGPGCAIGIGARVLSLVSVRRGFADYVLAPCAQLVELPNEMSFATAAGLRVGALTALHAFRNRARLRGGETVLVFGAAGGVGSAAIQVARLLGATVIAAASTEAKRAFARTLGADATIDTDPDGWRDRLRALCGSGGPDVILDPVCGPLFEAAFRSLSWNGRHLVVGFTAGPIPALRANLPLIKGAALIGVEIRQFNINQPAEAEENRQTLRQWIAEGTIHAPTAAEFRFGQFREALEHALSGAGCGKTILSSG